MNNKFKRILVILMSSVIAISSCNLPVFAAEMEDERISVTSEEVNMIPDDITEDYQLEEIETVQETQDMMEESADEEIAADEIEPILEDSVTKQISKPDSESAEAGMETEEKAKESFDEQDSEVNDSSAVKVDGLQADSGVEEKSDDGVWNDSEQASENESSYEANSDTEVSEEDTSTEKTNIHEEAMETKEQGIEEPADLVVEQENDIEAESLNADADGEVEVFEEVQDSEFVDSAKDSEGSETSETQEASPLEDKVTVQNPFVPMEAFYESFIRGQMGYPLPVEAVITTCFGKVDDLHITPHTGIDLAVDAGTPVLAAEAGLIVAIHMWDGTMADSYGNYVDIEHENGLVTRYGHLSEINIQIGNEVLMGQQIGRAGSTGRSTGDHLHFEVIAGGTQVDPMPYFEKQVEVTDDTVKITVDGWGAGFDIAGYEIFEGQLGSISVNSENKDLFTKVDEHSLVFDKAVVGTELVLRVYTGWTYASAEVVYMDDTTAVLDDLYGYNQTASIDLSNVKEVHLTVGSTESAATVMLIDSSAPAPQVKAALKAPSLKAAALTSGSTTITLMPESGHSGRSYDSNGNHLFCLDMSMPTPYDGQTFNYGAVGSYLSATQTQAMYFTLYNYWVNRYPSDGTATYDMTPYCSESGWPFQNMITGVVWKIMGFTPSGYDDSALDAINDMAAKALAYASSYPNGKFPENTIEDSVSILYPVAGENCQPLISIGKPVFKGYLNVLKTPLSVGSDFVAAHPFTGAVYGVYTNFDTVTAANNYKTDAKTTIDSGTEGTCATITIKADGTSDPVALDPGNYWVIEITRPTDSVWQWDYEIHSVTVTSDDTEDSPVTVESKEDSVGDLKLTKTSSNYTLTNGNPCYKMSGIKYNVYTTNTGTAQNPVLSGQVGTLTITSYDVATSTGTSDVLEDLPAGTYWVQEVKTSVAGTGYEYSKVAQSVTVEAGKVNEVSFADNPLNDPARLGIYKVTADNRKKPISQTAIFKVEYFTSYDCTGTVERSWDYITINGLCKLDIENYLDTSQPQEYECYKDENGAITFPLGSIRVTEKKAPVGFKKASFSLEGRIRLNDTGDDVIFEWYSSESTNMIEYSEDGSVNFGNEQIFGGVKFAKIDAETGLAVPQGAGTFNGVQIAIYNNSGAAIEMPDGTSVANGAIALTITGNSSGIATTAAKALPVGDYYAVEVAAPTGYKLNTGWRVDFSITDADDGVIIDKTEQASKLPDTPIRGGVQIEKWDKDLQQKVSQGDADFAGIQFEITTLNTNPVRVNNTDYANGQVVYTMITNAAGDAVTAANLLPFGSYSIKEVASNGKYRLTNGEPQPFTISVDGQIVSANTTGNAIVFEDEVVTGKVALTKNDTDLATNKAQGDASLAGIKYAVVNRSAKMVKVDGTEYAVGTVVAILTTDAEGKATIASDLPYGTYQVYELRADATIAAGDTYNNSTKLGSSIYANDAGYLFKDQVQSASLHEDGQLAELTFDDAPLRGGVAIEKWDAELDEQSSQGDADFSGIQFEIKNQSAASVVVDGTEYAVGEVVMTIESDRLGNATTGENDLPYGTYSIKEVETNEGYLLTDGTEYTFEIRVNGEIVDTDTSDEPIVFKDEVVRGGVSFLKIDKEMNEATAQGQATLESAEIEIYNISTFSVIVDDVEYAPGEVVLTLTTDADGKCETAADALPYGTYYAVETAPSEGYLVSDWRVDFQIREDGVMVDTSSDDSKTTQGSEESGWFKVEGNSSTSAAAQLPEQIKRLDIQFTKVDIDGTPMAGIPFLISLLDKDGNVIESHVIVSDANGGVNTANRPKSGTEVNALDEYVRDGKFIDESQLAETTGVWFGAADSESQAAGKGSLIYGQYRIEELQCSANEGQVMLKQKVFTVDPKSEEDSDLTVEFVDGITKTLGNIFIDLIIHPESDLIDVLSETKVASLGQNAVYRDTVRYDHLKITQEYKIKTEIYYEDKNGTITKLGENTIPFTPAKVDATNTANGTIDNDVTIDASALNGGKLHAVDTFYATIDGEDVELVSHNTEMTDERQTILVPYMSTTASDSKTKDHVGTIEVEAEINDVVRYENLADKGMYRLVGILREASTGEIVKGSDGNDCIVEAVLRIDKRQTAVVEKDYGFLGPISGDVTMPAFRFDATDYEGKTLVVTEILFDNDLYDEESGWEGNDDAIIINHDSLTDENQSIHYLSVQTEAMDEKTGTRTAVVGEKETIIDLVTVENGIVGMEYTINGELFYVEDCVDANGTEHKKGELIANQKEPVTVIAEAETFTVPVEFEVDSSLLEGTSGVVFEGVTHKGIEVATHHDYEAKPQTPHWPKVRTMALDADTLSHTGKIGEDAKIDDDISLTNLNIDDSYKVVGTLKFQDDGSDVLVDGKPLVVESDVFTATEANMTIHMLFEFSSLDMKGRSVVVFETLYFVNPETGEEVEVSRHTDLSDSKQTINFMDGGTTATDSETEDHIAFADEKVTIYDRLTYHNARIGVSYSATGQIYVVETGEPLMVNGKPVMNTVTFVATQTDGVWEIPITFDASLLQGQKLVVFEDVEVNKVTVFVEHEIDNPPQTVYVPELHTLSADGVTGDHIGLADGKMTLKDTVTYSSMLPDRTYLFKGIIMVRETNEPLLVNGKEVIVEKEVKITEPDGEITIEFEFDGNPAGKTLVVFESAYLNGKLVAGHTDISSYEQSEYIPDGHTTASDGITGDHLGRAAEKVYVEDRYFYSNLIPDREYTVFAKVYLETGEALKIDGKEITKEVTFTADKESGYVDIKFDPFDGSVLMGKTIIVGETLKWKDFTIQVHLSLEDEEQAIHYPVIGTTFTDSATKDHIAAVTEKITLTDKVEFKNLVPSKTYEMQAEIFDRETGKSLGYTETVEFSPETEDGYVLVEFTLDRAKVAGKSLVAFETLLFTNDLGVKCELADHKEIDDDGQTVRVPDGHTTAKDSETGNHTSHADEEVTIVDRVFFENLIPNKEYTIVATLMNKDSGNPILLDGEPFVVTKTFKTDKEDGYEDIEFGKFNATLLAGHTVVVFENILYEGVPVIIHADLNDLEETIFFPEIKTVATYNGGKTIPAGTEKVEIVDTVSFKNLQPGVEVTLKAILMDKQTGKAVETTVDGKKVPVTAELVFKPDTAEGTVEIKLMPFSVAEYTGHDLVLFETLVENDIEKTIAHHEDFEDKDQTVTVLTPPDTPKTGDDTNAVSYAVMGAAALAGLAIVLNKKKKEEESDEA